MAEKRVRPGRRIRPGAWAALAAGIALVGAGAVRSQDDPGAWEVHLHEQRPYLTVEAIQRNYGFERLNRSTETFELRGAGALVEGRIGAASVRVNRLDYALHYPPVLKRGHRLVSAYDVTNLLDLLLRPGDHMRPGELKTVYLQAMASAGDAGPEAADFTYPMQEILSEFGLVVRLLPEDAEGVVGDAMRIEEGGGTVWLRFRGNAALGSRTVRCGILAPPESPRRGEGRSAEARRAVYLGNLHDAESLALATLIQTGVLFGPAAEEAGVKDGGIRQDISGPFQRASGAAVQVEWGADTDPEHLLKSLVAGLVRYRSFLSSHAAWMARNEERRAAASGFAIGEVGLELDRPGSGLNVSVEVRAGSSPDPAPDPAPAEPDTEPEPKPKPKPQDLEVHCFVFTAAPDGKIDLLETPPPKVTGGGAEDWTDGQGHIGLWYSLPASASDDTPVPPLGYVVRLLHRGEVLHVAARPGGLLNQLWRFTSVRVDP
jgi:hypothetical protein